MLRRSPALVTSSSPSPRRRADGTLPRPQLDQELEGRHRVERVCDPTDPSTERMAPPQSTHIQLGDVPQTLDLVEAEGEFLQHNGVVTVMMKLPMQGFA